MTARELDEKLIRTGHEKMLRQMAVNLKLAKPEELAVMSCSDVCALIVENGFTFLDPGEEGFFLIRTEDIDEVKKKLWHISR